jgi:hypothetical protein
MRLQSRAHIVHLQAQEAGTQLRLQELTQLDLPHSPRLAGKLDSSQWQCA